MRKLSRGYGVCERYRPVLAPEVVSRQVAGDRLLLDENVGQDRDVDVAPGSDHRALNHATIVTREPVPAARAAETEPGQPKPRCARSLREIRPGFRRAPSTAVGPSGTVRSPTTI